MNKNLNKAKKDKNDEFYTQIDDIEKELSNYKNHFKGKIVFCNCDRDESNFVKYFIDNFNSLGLKRLIYSHYDGVRGDFRSTDSIDSLKKADIVVTNPPFSLFREYVAQLVAYDKKFLIIGSMNAITYKEIFKLIKNEQLWLGNNNVRSFTQPDGSIKKFGNINWFTNLDHNKRHKKIALTKTYTPEDYPEYDNYAAINVNKVKEIPVDYTGDMGVPITFLDKHNPKQFKILGIDRVLVQELTGKVSRFYIKGKEIYARIVIRINK